MEKLTEIIMKNVHEVLDKYLAAELTRDIENEIRHSIDWDLAHIDDEEE